MRAPPAGARAAATLAAVALALGCAAPPAGPAAAHEPLEVTARAVDVAPTELSGLRQRGAVALTAAHRAFGGFSGLLVEGGGLTAVTDAGWLLSAALDDSSADGPSLGPATFAPLPGDSGGGRKSASDAESLARGADGRLAIGFERDHRVEVLDGPGGRVTELRDPRWERLASNNGLEALASLPGGGLLAIAEEPSDGAFPVFALRPGARIDAGTLAARGRHSVTGADVGPDGRLYLVRRDFALLTGLSIRVERYHLDADGFPRAETREVLGAWESLSGIDNMEGIALWTAPGGEMRLALISDDNFSALQRTLLMVFAVEE